MEEWVNPPFLAQVTDLQLQIQKLGSLGWATGLVWGGGGGVRLRNMKSAERLPLVVIFLFFFRPGVDLPIANLFRTRNRKIRVGLGLNRP